MHGEENGACREVPLGKNQLELRYSAPFSCGGGAVSPGHHSLTLPVWPFE